ncbi:hypothetical protein [Nocardia sp. A7]|uniref:hypothetical protein n=1 Tax=Nocardia sp. A7 TaxID=2789274 RepID=UPI0039795215
MAGRLALVVASQCDELPRINDIDVLARELLSELSQHGGWASATDDGAPLVNPTHSQLRDAFDQAFTAAAEREATLLISFVGHGFNNDAAGAYYLLATDSPAMTPTGKSALDLGYEVKEGLNLYGKTGLDGLIVLVDACQSGGVINRAGQQWLALIPHNASRMELLTASAGDEPAYNACFTRTAIHALRTGDPRGESQMLVSALRVPPTARGKSPGI